MDRHEREEILSRLRRDARAIAEHFGLSYRDIVADRATSRYGVCYDDGLIKVRLYHARTDGPLKYSSLIDTLCHELAHLKHFNHGPEFKAFFFRLLGWARRQGIYRPGPARGEEPGPPRVPAHALTPPRRNGVAVFPRDAGPPTSLELPWADPPRAPRPEPSPPRLEPSPPRPEPSPPRLEPSPPRPAPPAARPRPEQLSLF